MLMMLASGPVLLIVMMIGHGHENLGQLMLMMLVSCACWVENSGHWLMLIDARPLGAGKGYS